MPPMKITSGSLSPIGSMPSTMVAGSGGGTAPLQDQLDFPSPSRSATR